MRHGLPRTRHAARRRRAWRWLLAGALAVQAGTALAGPAWLGPPWVPRAAPPVVTHAVKDPYYGVTLYDYFLQNYFSALSDLMVAQHFGRLSHHTDEAEVLRGGLYLSYGLHREAAEIFTRLIDANAAPPVRDRAWYFLAKIRYQRGLAAEAEAALGHIEQPLPPALEEDRLLLKANLLMMRADYLRAVELLKPRVEKDKSAAGLYVRYNLGVALVRSGSVARGSELLDEIGVEPGSSEELRSLRDKANVALGFAALQAKDPERARFYLDRVRLTGMQANRALLAYGWAADAQQHPADALVPWTELAKRDISDPAVQEALLAVAYGTAEAGASAQALESYGKAVAAYQQENANLDETIAAIRSGSVLDELVARNPGDEMGWFWRIDRLPRMAHPVHLSTILAQHSFQEAFKNYRDLRFLQNTLRLWNDKLAVLDDMLANRRAAFAQRLPATLAAERTAGIGRLDARRAAVAAELAAAEQAADGSALADAGERALQERLARVRATLDALPADGNDADGTRAQAQERYRRVAGALTWQLAQQYPQHRWEAERSLHQLDAALGQAHTRDGQLLAAQKSEPQHFDDLAGRIAALRQRIAQMQPRIEELAQLQQQAVQDVAVAELESERERLDVYMSQARYAIAEIYDRASAARDANHAPAPK